MAFMMLKEIPGSSSWHWVHARWWFIKYHYLKARRTILWSLIINTKHLMGLFAVWRDNTGAKVQNDNYNRCEPKKIVTIQSIVSAMIAKQMIHFCLHCCVSFQIQNNRFRENWVFHAADRNSYRGPASPPTLCLRYSPFFLIPWSSLKAL